MRFDIAREDVLSELVNVSGDDNTQQLLGVILLRRISQILLREQDVAGPYYLVSEILVRVVASMMMHHCMTAVRDFLHVTSTTPHVL